MSLPPDTDRLDRFLLPHAGVRGVRVHLHDAWHRIRASDDYPAGVRATLGEAVAASALFTAHAKVEGRLSIQLRGQGALRSLFAECTAAGTLRGLARFEPGPIDPELTALRALAGDALLAITVENPGPGREAARYQGMVEIGSDTLAGAFEGYFQQSEQLPTRLLLAVDDTACAGLMVQKLPGDEGDDDGWNRTGILFDTLRPAELLAWSAQTLGHRLFAEEATQWLDNRALRFGCSCSRERVAAMLESLGHEEATAATQALGFAEVRCEFCGQRYPYTPEEIDALFTPGPAPMAAPERLQ